MSGWPPQVIAALVALAVALIAMAPSIVREFKQGLLERSAANSRRVEAEAAMVAARAAEVQAAAAMRTAEARAREAEAKITVSDREQLARERQEDREETKGLRLRIERLEAALHESELGRAHAEEDRMRLAAENHAMRDQFAAFHAEVNAHEVRASRPPKRTPPAFASADITQPYGLQKAAT